MALGLAVAGLLASEPTEAQVSARGEQSVKVENGASGRIYLATVLAPDACYHVPEAETRTREGAEISVTRQLVRKPGLCASVITPIEVTGPLPDVAEEASAFRLVLRDDTGAIVFDARTEIAP